MTPEGGRPTASRDVFVTGGTGYIGSRLIRELISRGHVVRALARPGSERRVPEGASAILGNALEAESFVHALRPGDTLVHLVGTPHPSPAKAKEFREIDLPSVRAAVEAARRAGASHFVYVSVAQPAPTMRAFVEVRAAGEKAIADANLTATLLRPWYVLGPGHRWPLLLVPFYGLAGLLPRLRDGAQRLGLVTLRQMVAALVRAVEDPPPAGTVRIVDVPAIRGA
ncbi:MAG TPA: NAD(P)H-binding protein [Thermoanaerobaculia bacterium]|nr:NAD(P)H-binding protein [Thermoanaerobaculia bacterium]